MDWQILREEKINKEWHYFCRCKCGIEKFVLRRNIKSNLSIKCRDCSYNDFSRSLIGSRIGSCTIVKIDENAKHGKSFICNCDCGLERSVRSSYLRNHHSMKCSNCHKNDLTKHSLSHIPEYKVWKSMIKRCFNKNDINYKNYGGRGIRVSDEWRDFATFIIDMGRRPSDDLEIDRINNDGNYEKGNCRWVTRKENMNNTRRSKKNAKKIS